MCSFIQKLSICDYNVPGTLLSSGCTTIKKKVYMQKNKKIKIKINRIVKEYLFEEVALRRPEGCEGEPHE